MYSINKYIQGKKGRKKLIPCALPLIMRHMFLGFVVNLDMRAACILMVSCIARMVSDCILTVSAKAVMGAPSSAGASSSG